jgi:hypothetical protein
MPHAIKLMVKTMLPYMLINTITAAFLSSKTMPLYPD